MTSRTGSGGRSDDAPAGRWWCLNLGDAMLADPDLERIRKRLAQEPPRASEPDDMVAFMRHESEGRLHCEVMVYFPPTAAQVAQSLGASACARPARGDLGLLAGHDNAFARWFDAD